MTRLVGRRTVGALVAVLATVGGVLVAAPAQAVEPPVLDSVSVSTTSVAAGGDVTVSYRATSADPLAKVWAKFVDSRNRYHQVDLDPTGSAGEGTLYIPVAAETDTWRLASVTLQTSTGLVTKVCATASVQCTALRDFSASSLSVRGLTPEYDAPRLASISVSPLSPTVRREGDPVTVSWSLKVPAPDLERLELHFAPASTADAGFDLTAVSGAALRGGTVTFTLPDHASDGDHALRAVVLCDVLENCATYEPDGRVILSGGARTPTGAQPSFAATVRVLQDFDAPVLSSLQRNASTVPLGGRLTATYSVQEKQPTLDQIVVRYSLVSDTGQVTLARSNAPHNGVVSAVFDRVGAYRLDVVELSDGRRAAYYQRDGTVTGDVSSGMRHTIDFAALDVKVLPSAPALLARRWPHGARIDVVPDQTQSSDISAWEVVAEPGHQMKRFANDGQTIHFTGLAAGTQYSVRVRALSTAGPGPFSKAFVTTPLLTSTVVGMGDISGDKRGDLIAWKQDMPFAFGYWGNGKGGITGGARNILNVVPGSRILPGGDLTGDGLPDLLAENRGRLELYHSMRPGGLFLTDPSLVGTGWGGMRFITGGGDFSGDGRADVLAVNSKGQLNIYAGNGRGKLAAGRAMGTGWGGFVGVFGSADLNGDRTRDILAVDRTGVLWLYPGNGRGGFSAPRTKVSSGWAGLAMVGPAGDFTGDGRADVLGITLDGALRVYPGNGRGHVGAARLVRTGWTGYF